MDREKRKALEAAGWRFGDAADFLGMTDQERQFLDARIALALAVRRQREAVNLTQLQLAHRIKTSQPRIARIERAAPDVSLDQILRAFTAAGGRIAVKRLGRSRSTKSDRRPTTVHRSRSSTVRESSVNEVQIQLIEG